MRVLEKKFVFRHGMRSFLILGTSLLALGLCLLTVCLVFVKPETVFTESVGLTTTGDYVSGSFHAEKGDWIVFSITSSNSSVLHLNGEKVGNDQPFVDSNIAVPNEVTYMYDVQINETDYYHVWLQNFAAHYTYYTDIPYPTLVYDNNTYTGNFFLKRTPTYYSQLLLSGEVLLAVSCVFLLVPTVPYFLDKARRLGMNAWISLMQAECQ